VIGKCPAGIPLERCGEIECDPLTSEINARRPEPGAAGMPARRPRERSWDDDAIEHHMTLFKLYSPLTTLSAGPARPLCRVSYPDLRGLPSSAPYGPPRALSVPIP
jgi:hypothetical protein